MQGGGSGEADLERIEVVQDTPIAGDVIFEAAEAELGVGELTVEQIAAVALVDDDAVVLVHCRRSGVVARIKGALNHSLDRSNVNGGVGVRRLFVEFLDAEGIGEGLQALHPGVLEGIGGLFAERGAVHEEKDAPKALGLEEAIDESKAGLGLAGTGRHGQQHLALSLGDRGFRGLDGGLLIVAKCEPIVEGFDGELYVGALLVPLE